MKGKMPLIGLIIFFVVVFIGARSVLKAKVEQDAQKNAEFAQKVNQNMQNTLNEVGYTTNYTPENQTSAKYLRERFNLAASGDRTQPGIVSLSEEEYQLLLPYKDFFSSRFIIIDSSDESTQTKKLTILFKDKPDKFFTFTLDKQYLERSLIREIVTQDLSSEQTKSNLSKFELLFKTNSTQF